MKWNGIILPDCALEQIRGGGPRSRAALELAKKDAGLVAAGSAYEVGARIVGAVEARLASPPVRRAAPPTARPAAPPREVTVHDLLAVI